MTLKDQLMKDLQDAMRSGDDLRKETLRMARSSVKNAEMMRSAEILDMVSRNDPAARGELFDRIVAEVAAQQDLLTLELGRGDVAYRAARK